MTKLSVRPTSPADIDALLKLQAHVYPTIAPWRRDQLAHQLDLFPEGQLVATLDQRIVGCASSLVIAWDEWADEHTWSQITAAGTFNTHNPAGFTLYGAEVFVDPRLRGKRVGHALYEGRRRICRQLNLRRIIACGRLPGYSVVAQQMSIELYAKKTLWGDFVDPVLSFQLREGFRYCGIMENYLPEDSESLGHAALIAWVNPDYDPARKPTLQLAAALQKEARA
ncbi:GNAT family N-acetyltransferase [Polaromonas sp.]|uniref:GNAT family N-acetyltransferase n=1 Tax=Polaromonas sp. TaxID=1869339 RepID=UPI002488EC25|nr:GNAT family N-acetyltransferase [Polaromonas sp.]MDI1342122.1 GNAT family N-acetyltransferase [Polaromonas sp.]